MAQWSQGNTPGAAIMVIRDGLVLHEKGYGLANVATKEHISSKTVFDIASVSKPFTAMAVMILVERGRLKCWILGTTDVWGREIRDLRSRLLQACGRELVK